MRFAASADSAPRRSRSQIIFCREALLGHGTVLAPRRASPDFTLRCGSGQTPSLRSGGYKLNKPQGALPAPFSKRVSGNVPR